MPHGTAATLPPERFRELLDSRQEAFGLSLPQAVLDKLSLYLSELDLWRRRINLVGKLGTHELALHALESVFGEKLITHGAGVVDVGSGAGFPGIPLAITRSDLSVTLLEPRAKRLSFLRHVLRTLPIGNAYTLMGRTSDLTAAAFDVATYRAVGSMAKVLGEAPFLKPRGAVLAWTTAPDELALSLAAVFRLEQVIRVPVSRSRAVALYRKESPEKGI